MCAFPKSSHSHQDEMSTASRFHGSHPNGAPAVSSAPRLFGDAGCRREGCGDIMHASACLSADCTRVTPRAPRLCLVLIALICRQCMASCSADLLLWAASGRQEKLMDQLSVDWLARCLTGTTRRSHCVQAGTNRNLRCTSRQHCKAHASAWLSEAQRLRYALRSWIWVSRHWQRRQRYR